MVKDNKPAVYDVGIDEAGYGPNLGPLVMTAIVARSEGPPPDLWKDMPAVEKVTKSDRTPQLLIDDSKRIMSQSQGMDWLEKVVQSLAATVNEGLSFQSPLDHWCSAFGPQLRQDNEMDLWVDSPAEMQVLQPKSSESNLLLKANSWAIYASRVVIAGPCRFNSLLGNPPNKASAHGIVFLEILRWLQSIAKPGDQFRIISDRHSGRKFYAPLLCQIFGDSWIEKISESQKQSSYRTEFENSLYDIGFHVSADSENALVAMASMVSKYFREKWMQQFNTWFARRIPNLRPTAGYPVDAKRFALEIELFCKQNRIRKETWWRQK